MARSGLEEKLDVAIREVFPMEPVIEDMPIKVRGKTLYVDRVLRNLKVAIEIDGSQHLEFVAFYHKDSQGFKDSQHRDRLKEEWLAANGYSFVRFAHNEAVTSITLRKKILKALCPHS